MTRSTMRPHARCSPRACHRLRFEQAEYAPGGTVPAWAAQYIGVRTEWLVNGDVEHMTPYPLPMSLGAPACHVPIMQLRAIELVGSILDDD